MNAKQKRDLLYRMMLTDVQTWSRVSVRKVRNECELSEYDDLAVYELLRKRLTSEEDLSAFQKVMTTACENMMVSFLSMFGGESYLADFFVPAIIDSETKEDLAPEEDRYQGEVYDLIYEYKESLDNDQDIIPAIFSDYVDT